MLPRLAGQDLVDAQHRTRVDPDRAVLVGIGPAEFSTSMALEPWPSIIWDPNLYYRDMGVHPKADKTLIRTAYVELGGEESIRLTMIAGVLLNEQRRLRYDLVPFGSLFFDDEIETAIRRKAASFAAGVREEGDEVDSDALNEEIESMRHQHDEITQLPDYQRRYPWSYYLLRSSCDDTDRLDAWRTGLVDSLREYGDLAPRFLGLGFVEGQDDFLFARVGYRVVLLFSDKLDVSADIVREAAKFIIMNTHNTQHTQGAIQWHSREASKALPSMQTVHSHEPTTSV